MHETDRFFHADDGRRHQGAETDQRYILSDRRLHDRLRRHIFAQIQDLEPIVLQHDFDDIFPDIMDIAFHSGEDDPSLDLLCLSLHGFLDHFEGGFGGVRAHKELGQKDRPFLKSFSHFVQRGDQLLIDQRKRLLLFQLF